MADANTRETVQESMSTSFDKLPGASGPGLIDGRLGIHPRTFAPSRRQLVDITLDSGTPGRMEA
jgi:hypothetical protein